MTDIPPMPRPQVTEYRVQYADACRAADGYEGATPRLVRTSTGRVRTVWVDG